MRPRAAFGLQALLTLALLIAAAALVATTVLFATLPDVSPLANQLTTKTSFMRRRSDGAEVPIIVEYRLAAISPLLACAVVKAEDREFFGHRGFDWRRIRNAAELWLRGRPSGGASTLTQQLARNLYLTPERSLRRKIEEALITRELERRLPKRRILEIYLNVAEWGVDIWGAPTASFRYFHKLPLELGAFEATFLASLLAAPRSPLVGSNAQRASQVQGRILNQLYASGLIRPDEWSAATARLWQLYRDLVSGAPLESALAAPLNTDRLPVAPPRVISETLAPESALSQECGLEREQIENERRLHAAHLDHTSTLQDNQ